MDNQNVLAVIAGEEITQKDVDALIAALPKEQQAYASNEHFRNQCLEQIITVHLFAKLGEEMQLEETDAFQDNLAHAKREILAQMAVGEAMKDIAVTEEETKEYYKANENQFMAGETVHAKHILVDEEDKCQRKLHLKMLQKNSQHVHPNSREEILVLSQEDRWSKNLKMPLSLQRLDIL